MRRLSPSEAVAGGIEPRALLRYGVGTMRAVAILLLMTSVTAAQAQYPAAGPSYARSGAAPVFSSVPTGQQASLARAMLEAHDAVRARVGVPPLAWSAQLAAVAQDWANHLIAAGEFDHRPDNRYGENLFAISGDVASPAQVVAAWADEGRNYDPRSNTCTDVCGHYTQIVWRATHSIGCGVATDPDHEVWVCEYDPPGNFEGRRPY